MEESKDYKLKQQSDEIIVILNKLLQKDIETPKNTLITLNRIKLYGDLSKAIIYYTVLPDYKLGTAKRFFKEKKKVIQYYFNQEWPLRRKPRLVFIFDSEEVERRELESLLDKASSELQNNANSDKDEIEENDR